MCRKTTSATYGKTLRGCAQEIALNARSIALLPGLSFTARTAHNIAEAEMEHEQQGRIAANEAAFRDVNEGIARGQWPGEADEPRGFRCECARLGCNTLVELSLNDYERIRANPRHFVMATGHELPDVESVVETGEGYVVVEKVDEAGRAAEARDRRA
jgi:hypothetical protein